MPDGQRPGRDLKNFVLPEIGKLLKTGDPWEPYQVLDPFGRPIEPAAVYLKDLMAADSSPLTPRSYGMDLLRWWRYLWAFEIEWDRAVREDARDFMLWMRLADKPVRVHWRHRGKDPAEMPQPSRTGRPAPGTPNRVTGKPTIGKKYAPNTRAHCETVLRSFYDFHLDRNTGSLLVNPFPLVRQRRSARANAHHNPEKEHRAERTGLYRPKVPKRIPRRIPDEKFTEVFAGLRSHRDRALLAFWIATGARAEELLTSTQGDAVVGQQTIGVIRKGTRDYQELPATRRFRLAAALPGRSLEEGSSPWSQEATLVDSAASLEAVGVRRGSHDVQPRQRASGVQLDAPRPTAYRDFLDARRPEHAARLRPAHPRPQVFVDVGHLQPSHQGRHHCGGSRSSRPATGTPG